MSGPRSARPTATAQRARLLSTTSGDLEARIPKIRAGSFYPSLAKLQRRIDRALWAEIMEANCYGVSIRKVDDLLPGAGDRPPGDTMSSWRAADQPELLQRSHQPRMAHQPCSSRAMASLVMPAALFGDDPAGFGGDVTAAVHGDAAA